MQDILSDLNRWLNDPQESGQIALATVIWTAGPAPRPAGARMAITSSGQMCGSVSGGCVEGAVFEEAQEVLASGNPKRLHYSVVDESGWEVGLACGGSIEVYVEPLREIHRRLLTTLAAEERVAFVTRLDGGGHLLAWPDGRTDGDLSLAAIGQQLLSHPTAARIFSTAKGDVFGEVFGAPPTLVIVGAVHIAVPLVRLAQMVGFRVQVVDARRTFATRERFPTVDDLTVAWPQEALQAESLGPQHHIVVLTHDPKFDLPALEIALRSRADYIGLLGSRRTQARRKAALREMGFDDTDLERIHGPVGLNLGGRAPAEIALAIMAEIVAVRNQSPLAWRTA